MKSPSITCPEKSAWSLICLLSVVCLLPVVAAQDDNTRGGWLERREPPVRPPATPRPTPGKKTPAPVVTPAPVTEPALGLGYTVFLKVVGADFTRVDPKRAFHTGEAVRLLLETSRNGFVYIFNQTDNGAPQMIFPNAQVQGGDNFIRAHYPVWVPDAGEIEFYGKAGTEKLTIVFSEKPLPGLPRTSELSGVENWPVPDELFQQVTRSVEVRRDVQVGAGRKITTAENSRDVKLRRSDPPPDAILVCRHPGEHRIVATVSLLHQP
ncbi:MAG: DUF4384 domain-containing protein [Blastocatellia bacterium]